MAERERPIILSGPMVLAAGAGRKTQTRRVVKHPGDFLGAGGRHGGGWDDPKCWGWEDPENPSHFIVLDRAGVDGDTPVRCPYGRPGDRLWVREAWADAMSDGGPVICYRADLDRRYLSFDAWPIEYERYPGCRFANWASDLESGVEGRWRSPTHMPRWASRLTLEITGVRVERLQEITDADAIAEGIFNGEYDAGLGRGGKPGWCYSPGRYAGTPRHAYELLWEQLNAARGFGWGANPWVWALSFRRLDP